MLNVTAETAAAVLAQPLDPLLRQIIEDRLDDAEKLGLSDLTQILVIDRPEDSEDAIIEEIGWSPLVHPIDETRWDDHAFVPYHAHLEDLGEFYEFLHVVEGSSFGYLFIIAKAEGVLPELILMCDALCDDRNRQIVF